MLKNKALLKVLAISTAAMFTMGACAVPDIQNAAQTLESGTEAGKTPAEAPKDSEGSSDTAAEWNGASSDSGATATKELSAVTSTGASKELTDLFTDRDYSAAYSDDETQITLNGTNIAVSGDGASVSGTTVTITDAGTYIVTGSLLDGQIVVDAEDKKVQIVLAGADMTNDDSACILIKKADKVFLTLADGTENTLSDTGAAYIQSDESMTVDAVIFSKETMTINGGGSLTINAGYKHGIVSKDNLKITDGSITISANGKGLQGKDSVRIGGGRINITKSTEGIEGLEIYIVDGDISITASDDGMNAASKDDNESDTGFSHRGMMDADEDCYIVIAGGNVFVNAAGDGLDSNGYLIVTGGNIQVDGPTSDGDGALDTGISAKITGGVIIAAGSSGMAETFESDSTQYSVLVGFNSTIKGGTTVTLTDKDGNTVMSATPSKNYSSVVFSSPALTTGTYTASAGDESVTVEITDISGRVNISGGFGGFGGRGGFGGNGGFGFGGDKSDNAGNGGDMRGGFGGFGKKQFEQNGEAPELPSGERPELPEGMTPPDGASGDALHQAPDQSDDRPKKYRDKNDADRGAAPGDQADADGGKVEDNA